MHPFFVTGIILAGGRGLRFDPVQQRFKLAVLLEDGRPVILAACQTLADHVDDLVLVDGPRARELDHCLPDGLVRRVLCDRADAGMGASLKAGVAASASADAWLVGLGDMPYVASSTVAALGQALRAGADIVRPWYRDQPGHPVGFSKALRDELLAIPDATGAAALIRDNRHRMQRIDVDDAGSIVDIDVPADLLLL